VHSRTVQIARQLRPGIRRILRVNEGLLILVEWIVGAATLYLDDSDPRPMDERLSEWLAANFDEGDRETVEELSEAMRFMADAPEGWIERLKKQFGKPFYLKLLGTALYTELMASIQQDSAVVVRALQRLAIQIRPLALALEDAITLVPENELASAGLGALQGKLLELMFDLEEQATSNLLPRLGIEIDALLRPKESDMDHLIDELRAVVADDSIAQVRRIGKLQNKISGARHALDNSDDGVSQAANSLSELIDRSFREANPKDSVVIWLKQVFPEKMDVYTFKHDKTGETRPTKLAEALCFTAGGSTHADAGTGIHRILALALAGARNRLQKYKHNDQSTDEEREVIRLILRGVEGAMVVGIRLGVGLAQMERTDPDVVSGKSGSPPPRS